MKSRLEKIQKQFSEDLEKAKDLISLETLHTTYFGRKGAFQELMPLLKEASSEEKPLLGKEINDLKGALTALYEEALLGVQKVELHKKLSAEQLDVTLPGRSLRVGGRHPITLVSERILEILVSMGFSVQYGPDIDSDYYNYEGLNFPPDHPARDMQDTFYISPSELLRSHTSNTQLRVMEKSLPPIRIAAPGTVFRNEEISSRSHVFFHQIEALYIDEEVSLIDLFGTIQEMMNRLFRKEVEIRFRPSFFPFVEPGAEVDIACSQCEKKGCRLCKGSGWLEVMGSGMVHPEVLKNGGIDPDRYSGFALGLGVERLTMLLYGIKDIRLFSANDIRFLTQFY